MSMMSALKVILTKRTLPIYSIWVRNFNHHLPPEHKLIQKTCRDFAKRELVPVAPQLDIDGVFPADQIKALSKLGLMSICVDKAHFGMGFDTLALIVAVEELSRGCASTGAIVSIHNCLFANLLNRLGTKRQKEKFLNPNVIANPGCFALSEPNAGSNVAYIESIAERDGDNWIINGTKSWVTSAHIGKAYVVFANTDKTKKQRGLTAFIVEKDTPGVLIGKKEELMGVRALSSCNVIFEDVKVSNENVLGNIGEGFKIAMKQLDQARIGIASQALGIAQAALDCAVMYSLNRQAFNKPIAQLSAVQHRIADMTVRLEAARLLTWKAAAEFDTGVRSSKHTSIAKLSASKCAHFVTDNCIQIMGGVGLAKRCNAERYYRDARVTQIYGGVTDIQKQIVAQQVIKEYANNFVETV